MILPNPERSVLIPLYKQAVPRRRTYDRRLHVAGRQANNGSQQPKTQQNMATALPTFPSFDPNADQGAPGVRFKKYISRFRNLIVATDIDDPKRQKAHLLHYIGEEVNDIFETLTVSEPAEGETVLDVTIKALSDYFTPKQNRRV